MISTGPPLALESSYQAVGVCVRGHAAVGFKT